MKKLDKMKPDQVCAWIKQKIRERYGDKVENKSRVWASHGFYYIKLPKMTRAYIARRRQLPALLKAIA